MSEKSLLEQINSLKIENQTFKNRLHYLTMIMNTSLDVEKRESIFFLLKDIENIDKALNPCLKLNKLGGIISNVEIILEPQ
jgi:hypothetical protein